MKHILPLFIFALSASLAPPSLATANEIKSESQAGWTAQTLRIRWLGNSVKKKYQGVTMPMDSIYSGDETTVGNVAFICHAGTFSVSAALKPNDFGVILKNPIRSKRPKIKRPNMKIDGESILSTEWIYMPEHKVYRAKKKLTAAKIYNSVLRKSKVEIKSSGGEYVSLNLPPVDRAFKNFGSECGLGIAAKKP